MSRLLAHIRVRGVSAGVAAFMCALALASGVALAAVQGPEAGGAGGSAAVSSATRVEPLDHGWVSVRDHRQQITHIFHLPPRGQGSGRASIGSIRPVAAVPQNVDGLAVGPWGYVAVLRDEAVRAEPAGSGVGGMGVASGGGGAAGAPVRQRRVLGQSVISGPGPFFEYPPGRPEVLASLPGMPELVGVATTRLGPVALMRDRARSTEPERSAGASDWTLLIHRAGGGPGAAAGRDEWTRLPAPWDHSDQIAPPDRSAHCWILPFGVRGEGFAGVRLIVRHEDADRRDLLEVWTADLSAWASAPANPASVAWGRSTVPLRLIGRDDAGPIELPDAWLRVREAGTDYVVSATWSDEASGGLTVHRWTEGGAVVIAHLAGVPRDAAMTVVGRDWGGGGIAAVWFEETGTGEGARPRAPMAGSMPLVAPKRRIVELTLGGRVLYDGGAQAGQTGLERDLELLAWLLVMTMVGVVVFVLRSERAFDAPRGYMPADPSRRLLAAFLDYVPAAIVAGLITDMPIRDAIFPFGFGGGGLEAGGARTLALALALAWAHTTLSEWLTGRSLGKAAMGLWVVWSSTNAASETKDRGENAEGEQSRERDGRSGALRLEQPAAEAQGSRPARSNQPTLGPDAAHPPLWAAAVRNLIRWGAPVVGLFMFLDRSRRHPGDVAGRTLVIQLRTPDQAE